jgi:hypothetical protein
VSFVAIKGREPKSAGVAGVFPNRSVGRTVVEEELAGASAAFDYAGDALGSGRPWREPSEEIA